MNTGPTVPDSVEALRALQLERLRATLHCVYPRVPHYRDAFDAAGVKPDDLQSLKDLRRFPFTTKANLRDAYPFGLFAVPMEEIIRLHASSGTTGKPTVVGYTAADIDMWSGLMARGLAGMGVGPADRIHSSFGYGLFTGGLGWHYGAERLGALILPASGGFTERHVQLILDLKPTVLMATPSYALVIADAAVALGQDPAGFGLRMVIGGAEPWSETMREEIEGRFRADAYDSYGLSEVIGPGVAFERQGDKGALTLCEDYFIVEIINPETGEVLPDGEEGEAVFTTLGKHGMPVVRYRSRDLTHLMPTRDGPFRRMARVRGRSDDMLIIRGVNVYPTQIEAILGKEPGLAPHYQLEVRRGNRRMDELTVRVETREGVGDDDKRDLGRRAEYLIKTYAGVAVTVEIAGPNTLERSAGKAKRIIDLRPQED